MRSASFNRCWLLPAAVGVGLNLLTRVALALRYRHDVGSVMAHPLAVIVLMAIAINSWSWSRRGTILWRGRVYAARGARGGAREGARPRRGGGVMDARRFELTETSFELFIRDSQPLDLGPNPMQLGLEPTLFTARPRGYSGARLTTRNPRYDHTPCNPASLGRTQARTVSVSEN